MNVSVSGFPVLTIGRAKLEDVRRIVAKHFVRPHFVTRFPYAQRKQHCKLQFSPIWDWQSGFQSFKNL